jgi:transcriptional regulator with XRE-family HTH domain
MVAANLARIRKERGLTQRETVERLAPFLAHRWSVASLSAAERSVDGKRIKEFDADELVALSRAFAVPLVYWFIPPPTEEEIRLILSDSGEEGLDAETLLDLVFCPVDQRHLLEQELLAALPGVDRGVIHDRLDTDTALLLRRKLHGAFGDLGQARQVLDRVASVLEQLEAGEQDVSSPAATQENATEPVDTNQHARRRKA